MSKSNQQATLNRVTLLESTLMLKNETDFVSRFHAITFGNRDGTRSEMFGLLLQVWQRLERCEILAAVEEAWGNGP